MTKLRPASGNGNEVKPETSWINIIIILVAGLAGFNFAYANNAISGSLAQTSFIEKFLTGPNSIQLIGGCLGAFNGGGVIGTVVQAPISTRWGRRVATGSGAVFLVISSALTAGSVNIAMFIVMRFFAGLGSGIVYTNAPVYMAEISPPHTRGLLVGSHALAVNTGLIISSLAALGFNFVDAPYQWRLQFVLLTFFSLCLLVSLFFLPESPRWLIEKDRQQEAKRILERLHKSPHDRQGLLAAAEFAQVEAQITAEKSLPSSWIYILRTPHLRKRAFCSYMMWVMGNSTGIVVITNLLPSILKTLGYGKVQQFGLSIAFISVAVFGTIINIFLVDKVGRVKFLVLGGYLSSIALLIEGVLQKYYLGTTNLAGLRAATAMVFVFIIFYGCTIEGPGYVYITEIWPTHLRSKGATIGFASFFLNSIAYTTPGALAFEKLGWKYYLVFFSVCVFSTTVIMFTFPETKGLTLEEINTKFGDTVELQLADIYGEATHGELKGGSIHIEKMSTSV